MRIPRKEQLRKSQSYTVEDALVWCKAQTEGKPLRYLVAKTSLMLLQISETLAVSPMAGDRFLIVSGSEICLTPWGYIGDEVASALVRQYPECWFISDDRDVEELERIFAL